MAMLGSCPQAAFDGTSTLNMNEISTVATAYALAGFATDPTHFSYSGSALAQTGLSNAISNIENLYSAASGQTMETTPNGNGVVPYKAINTLGNILAACIQSNGPTSTPCSVLLSNTAALSGSAPTDTAAAALNIAHNPGANVAALFSLASRGNSFGPVALVGPQRLHAWASTSQGGG